MKEKFLNVVRTAKEKVSNVKPSEILVGVMVTAGTIVGLALASYAISQRSEEDMYYGDDGIFESEVDLGLEI
jgi:hypothetical protein